MTCWKENYRIYLAIGLVELLLGLKACETCVVYLYLHYTVLIYFFLALHCYLYSSCYISSEWINKFKRRPHEIGLSLFIDKTLDRIMLNQFLSVCLSVWKWGRNTICNTIDVYKVSCVLFAICSFLFNLEVDVCSNKSLLHLTVYFYSSFACDKVEIFRDIIWEFNHLSDFLKCQPIQFV